MSLTDLLELWRGEPSIAASIQVWHEIPARQARIAPFPEGLHPAIAESLKEAGIKALYTHQAASFETARGGKSLVVVTGTASGKSLCYNLPVLDCLLKDPEARALYLFPTKALAQDQAASLTTLLKSIEKRRKGFPTGDPDEPIPRVAKATPVALATPLAIYDGDTPSSARQAIRSTARLMMTNPDMLHIGILPHHTRWMNFLSQLRYVIIDEAHAYRGVFGSHVANVLRRLIRIAHFYGAQPQFILTSATIANPIELASNLTELDMTLIDQDGSGRGPKTFILYNPPVIDKELGLRRSALQEGVRLTQDLLAYQVQTILFARSRRSVEIILSYLRQADGTSGRNVDLSPNHKSPERIRGYRSGYLPEKRREIERGLREGLVQAVVATNALELGIDIGEMGAAVMVGYPGAIAAAWQQAGRAGRGAERAMAVMIATADPLDQFLAAHPEYFFDRSPEQALINPDNPLILLDHLRCAAFELPFQTGETFGRLDPGLLADYLAFLAEQGVLHQSGSKFFWMADQYPAQSISLRSADSNPILLQAMNQGSPLTIGQIDYASAHWMVHQNAIYLHEAETYLVEDLDLEQRVARLRQMDTDYYTLPRRETTVQLIQLNQSEAARGAEKSHGEILVTSQVTGYKKIRWMTHEIIGLEMLNMPPVELLTTGYWLTISEQTVVSLKEEGLWNNDPNDYGPNWDSQRKRARQRDGYCCQVCGANEQERAHHVHHKTPFKMYSSYVQANVLENLTTLCPDCHRRVEAVVRVRSGLAGLAYVLGTLAPLFLMCDTADLGVHSDPQSPLATGRPTVVVYDQIPAGIGFSQRLYEIHDELIQRAYELVAACACTDGCPSCVGPGGEQGAGGKQETLAMLRSL